MEPAAYEGKEEPMRLKQMTLRAFDARERNSGDRDE